jgi:hypothetical protein
MDAGVVEIADVVGGIEIVVTDGGGVETPTVVATVDGVIVPVVESDAEVDMPVVVAEELVVAAG